MATEKGGVEAPLCGGRTCTDLAGAMATDTSGEATPGGTATDIGGVAAPGRTATDTGGEATPDGTATDIGGVAAPGGTATDMGGVAALFQCRLAHSSTPGGTATDTGCEAAAGISTDTGAEAPGGTTTDCRRAPCGQRWFGGGGGVAAPDGAVTDAEEPDGAGPARRAMRCDHVRGAAADCMAPDGAVIDCAALLCAGALPCGAARSNLGGVRDLGGV